MSPVSPRVTRCPPMSPRVTRCPRCPRGRAQAAAAPPPAQPPLPRRALRLFHGGVAAAGPVSGRHGRALHAGEVSGAGAGAGPAALGAVARRLRAALLGAGAVLPAPRGLGGRAAGAARPPGPARGAAGAGRAGGPGAAGPAGDQGAGRAAVRQGPALAGALRPRGRQAGAGQRRRPHVLRDRAGAGGEHVRVGAAGEQLPQLRRLRRGAAGGRAGRRRLPRPRQRALAQGHHAHDQVRRGRHRPRQEPGGALSRGDSAAVSPCHTGTAPGAGTAPGGRGQPGDTVGTAWPCHTGLWGTGLLGRGQSGEGQEPGGA